MPVAIELLGEGKRLAQQIGTHLSAVLCGDDVSALANELTAYGADKVYLMEAPSLKATPMMPIPSYSSSDYDV